MRPDQLAALEALERALGWSPKLRAQDEGPEARLEAARTCARSHCFGPRSQRERIAQALAQLEAR